MSLKETIQNWEMLGKEEPLWAILNDKRRKGKPWSEEEFFATGKEEVKEILDHLSALGLQPKPTRALDFGCGVGRVTLPLTSYFREVHGVDAAASMIALARHYGRDSRCVFHVQKEANLSFFPDDFFSFVYSNITLQHMEPRYATRYIKEFVRILEEGGVCVFQLPSHRKEPARPPVFKERLKKILPSFLRRFVRTFKGKNAIIEMYGTKKDVVAQWIREGGGRPVDIAENSAAGEGWVSFLYTVVPDEG